MGNDFRKASIESAFRRRAGTSPEVAEGLRVLDKEAKDWYGRCQACGEKRMGTMAELRRPHDCEGTDG